MSQTGPWSKFSTDQRARDAAREAAMAEGITLGEYLNRLLTLVDEPQPGETHYSYSRRTGTPIQQHMPHTQAPNHMPAPDSAATLDRITRRIEATEARSTLAINGMDHTVLGLVARLENTERTTASVAGHVEGLIDEMRVTHESLQTKVRRLEHDETAQRSVEALKALEGALGKLATHVYEEGELTQNETAAIKGRIESGFIDLTDRVESVETRVEGTLSDAAARVERAVQQAELRAESATRGLTDRVTAIESQVQQGQAHNGQAEGRLRAVEADVSGALNSMESTLIRIQERLNRAETGTDSALKSLETTFAHLDERIEAVASQIDPEQAERLKQEFERRFEDLTRSVRSAVDNARLDLATEITKAASGSEERLEDRLKAEVGELKARLADVEARPPTDLTATVQEEIGRLGATVAERIDALAAHVEDRIEESEHRSAEAIEQVGEQVTVAAVRLQKRQDEALTALVQDIDGMRKASDARLSDALSSVSERLERMHAQSSESISPVQRAIVALATRLESIEAFSTPPHVPVPPPVLPADYPVKSAEVPLYRDRASSFATPPAPSRDRLPEPQATFGAPKDESPFEAGFAEWEVAGAKAPENPYQADFDAMSSAAGALSQMHAEAPPEAHTYVAELPEDDGVTGDARAFDPIAELGGFHEMDDSLEGSHSETRESDIFDEEPGFEDALAEPSARPTANAASDASTADYLARARRAAMTAAEPSTRSKPRAAPLPVQKSSGGSKVPMLLAASAVVITGAGVGGYLYLRGKQPVVPAFSGPVDTYVDPAPQTASARPAVQVAAATPAAPRPAPIDAEQMLFEDEQSLIASALFGETETAAAQPTPIIASVQTVKPSLAASRPAAKADPKPATPLTAEQSAIRSIISAADAIEAGSAPSLKPATPPGETIREARRAAPVSGGSLPAIPEVVTVEAEANAGNAVAQYQYAQVKLTEGDLATASAFLRRASQKGIAPAQYELGKLYERGQGVDKDIIEARALIQKAAEAGHVSAMYDYALFLAEGEGGAKSEADAVTWFQKAAEHGLVDAQYNLGVVHAEGIGTAQDLATALFWFQIASKAGDTGAEQEVANLRTRLSMADSMEAIEKAARWKAAAPNALANGRYGAQRWNTGNPLQVKAVQTALGRLGFDAGTPDGVLGPQTGDAISDYQAMENLDVTGTITPELVDHINARASGTRSS